MAAKEHRVALIGAGRIAAVHLGFARQTPNTHIVGVCDVDRQRAESFARARNVAAFTDVDEMMRRTEPNIVHVVTPPATHAPLAIAAMRRGANVFVEKPMAMTVAEAQQMCEVAIQHGRRICVDHNRLFDPVILRARRLLESGALGEIVSVEAHQGVNLVEEAGAAAGGSKHWSVADRFAPLYNLGPHPLYLVDHFLGPFDQIDVRGQTASEQDSMLREIRILLSGRRGFATVAFSMGAQPYLNHLTLYGTRATLRANLNTMTLIVERVRHLPKLVAKLAANLEPAGQMVAATVHNVLAVALRRMKLYPGIGENIRRFYRSLDEGDPPPVSVESGIAVVRLLNEIQARLDGGQLDRTDLAPHARGETVVARAQLSAPTEKDAPWTS